MVKQVERGIYKMKYRDDYGEIFPNKSKLQPSFFYRRDTASISSIQN